MASMASHDPPPRANSLTSPEIRYLLVMTATVTPAAGAGVKRADPRVRMDDYKQALRYWLTYAHPCADRILFLENSTTGLDELRDIASNENPRQKSVEFLSIQSSPIPAGSNYGYSEMELLDRGLEASRLRHETTHMIKVTGRLIFPALGKALDRTPKPLELLVDCRKLGFPRRGFDANTQVFACFHSFYDRVLRDAKREMNSTDVRLLEHLIYRKVAPFRGQPGTHLRFPCNVEPVGYSGFKSRRYDSPRAAFTRSIRAVLRVIAPNFWF